MKTILAPTDFSASSVNAVFYAANLAVFLHARLVLFHAIPFPIAISQVAVPGEFIDDMMEVGEMDLADLYEKVIRRTRDKITVSKIVKIGTVEQEIENISHDENPLAIVMAIRSGKSIERALMGSSIFHVMNHVAVPTLIIPENKTFTGLKHIGMACDLKMLDGKLPIDTITEWLELFNAELDIINVATKESDFKSDQMAESISLQTRLSKFKPRFHFLTGNHITDELNEFISKHPLDLLMIFPGNHGAFKLFHKKRSRLIVTHNQIPILSIYNVN